MQECEKIILSDSELLKTDSELLLNMVFPLFAAQNMTNKCQIRTKTKQNGNSPVVHSLSTVFLTSVQFNFINDIMFDLRTFNGSMRFFCRIIRWMYPAYDIYLVKNQLL